MSDLKPNERPPAKSRRISIFWPLFFIAIGVVFLLHNLDLMPGSAWDTIFRLWPLLLVAMGLDGIWRRQGLVGSSFLIGVGVIFLLNNFGYLAINVWQVIFNLWPVLLIAIGFDILIGRRSILLSVLGLVVVLGILVGSIWVMSVNSRQAQALEGYRVSQSLDGADRARVKIDPGAGSLQITSLSGSDLLIEGTAPGSSLVAVQQQFVVEDNVADYAIRAASGTVALPGSANTFYWDLGLNPDVPLELSIDLGAGDAFLDATHLSLSDLAFDMGVGQVTLLLPQNSSLDGAIDGAIGQIIVIVPRGVGIKIQKSTAMVVVEAPDSYRRQDDIYTSPEYDTAENKIDLNLELAIGRLVIRQE